MVNYLDINRDAYDATAREYPQRAGECSDAQKTLIDMMELALQERGVRQPFDILELGPGAGMALKEMTNRGHTMTALEFSRPMADIAHIAAPSANIIVDEFLAHDFGRQQFDALYLVAFLHLFSSSDAPRVLEKIERLLYEYGVAVVSVSKHAQAAEGFERKDGFHTTAERYRRHFTKEELDSLIGSTGLTALSYTENDGHGKRWANYILGKY